MLQIRLSTADIHEAITAHLNEKYSLEVSDRCVEYTLENKGEMINLHRYTKDSTWDKKKEKWIVHNEYKVQGIFIKRKKKGCKNSQYVEMAPDCVNKYMTFWEESYNIEMDLFVEP